MSHTFKLERCPYNKGEILYKKKEITLEPGVTVLVGCNGSGKTTFLQTVQRQLKAEKVPFISYDNLFDGGHNAKQAAMWRGNAALAGTLMCSSEGEQIMTNLCTVAGKLRSLVDNNKGEKEIFILFDAIDSGFSVDNVHDVKTYLFDAVLKDAAPIDVYIIVSANAYEMCCGEKCFDVREGKYRQFKSYEAYRNFILRSRAHKDKRYGE